MTGPGGVLEFPDVSHFETGVPLNGVPAVVAKVSQGVTFTDPAYRGFRDQAAALRIPLSGYHWIDTTDPGAQARWYHSNAAGAPCMWDAEAPGATVPRILAASAALRRLGGHDWGVYLPHWWWQGHIGSPDLRPLTAAGLVLVSSDYRTAPAGAGWMPYGGVAPTVWQYTDNQPLHGTPCDFNRYHGTPGQLADLFAGTTTPEGTPMFAFKEQSSTSVWLSDGLRRRPVEWQSFGRMCSAGIITKPPAAMADGIGASAYVLVIPDGQADLYGGPIDTATTAGTPAAFNARITPLGGPDAPIPPA